MKLEIKTNNLEETEKLAKDIAKVIEKPSLILLDGEMSSGKTTFVNAFTKAYGSVDETGSPTFSIINTYNSPNGTIYHLDLYRLADEDELYAIGFDDILDDQNAITFIEWPEIAHLSSKANYNIKIDIKENNKRNFTITGDKNLIESLTELNYGK